MCSQRINISLSVELILACKAARPRYFVFSFKNVVSRAFCVIMLELFA